MLLKIIIILLLKFSGVYLSCVNFNYGNYLCNYIVSAFYEQSEDWTRLTISNSHNQALVPLKKTSFEKINQLEELKIYGSINNIEPNIFQVLKAKHIDLKRNKLPFIGSQTFSTNFTSFIQLENNGILQLPPVFGGSSSLDRISINKEKIQAVLSGVFDNIRNLKELSLAENKISFLQVKVFYDLPLLKVLDLEKNQIEEFDSDSLFSSNSLQKLILSYNNLITNILTFRKLTDLEVLYLDNNFITYIQAYTFQNNLKLKRLYLSNNRLTILSAESLPPNVVELSISYNNLTALQISNFSKELPAMKNISVVGNPWQCPCWLDLRELIYSANLTQLDCAKDYLDGKIPVCVAHEDSRNKCEQEINDYVQEMSQIYYEGLAEYNGLPNCGPVPPML